MLDSRFPEIIRYVVQRIKLFCPTLGKVKIADRLAQAGLHIGKTTVQRILKEKLAKEPEPSDETGKQSRIVAKYAGHTMHADLTTVPISGGFWTDWVAHSLWQHWPVGWWLLNVVDHSWRRSMGFAVFKSKPSSEEVTAALDRMWLEEGIRPKHLIVDQGPMFKCHHFEEKWCKARNIEPRFGAAHRSFAGIMNTVLMRRSEARLPMKSSSHARQPMSSLALNRVSVGHAAHLAQNHTLRLTVSLAIQSCLRSIASTVAVISQSSVHDGQPEPDLHPTDALPLRAWSGTCDSPIQIVKDQDTSRGPRRSSEGRLWPTSRRVYVHDENRWSRSAGLTLWNSALRTGNLDVDLPV